ncbi:hypothetical protein [Pseudoneobacillus sp. C159]
MKNTKVTIRLELLNAIYENVPQVLEVQGSILSPHSIPLPEGYQLTRKNIDSCIVSFNNSDGFGVTRNNTISNLTVLAKQTEPFIQSVAFRIWGKVKKWISHDPVISYGPSGIGFVNFGTVTDFLSQDIITYGLGASWIYDY